MKKKRSDSQEVQLTDGSAPPTSPAPSASPPPETARATPQALGAAAVCVRLPESSVVVCGVVVGPAPSPTGEAGSSEQKE